MHRGRQSERHGSTNDSKDRTRSCSVPRSNPSKKLSRPTSQSLSSHQPPMLLQAVLQCPACTPPGIVSKPTTLLCGHTVCAKHITLPSNAGLSSKDSLESEKTVASPSALPSCPILSCHTPAPGGPRYLQPRHPTSADETDEVGVIYIPPPSSRALRAPPPPDARIRIPQPRLDVTLTRVLAILNQFPSFESLGSRGSSEYSSGSEFDHHIGSDNRSTAKTVTRSKSRSSSVSSGSAVRNIRHNVAKLQLRSRTSSPRRSSASPPHARDAADLPATKRRRRESSTSYHSLSNAAETPSKVSPGTHSPPLPSALSTANNDSSILPSGLIASNVSIPLETQTLEQMREALLPELTCDVCYQLYYDPVTTPCQHTFCSKCILRSLDHSLLCPLCREELPGFSFYHDHPSNTILLSLIKTLYPEEYASRKLSVLSDESLNPGSAYGAIVQDPSNPLIYDNVPIFPCTLAFPYQPVALNIFEPRYRLMIRRIMANFASTSYSHLADASEMDVDTTTTGNESPAASFGMTLHPNPFTGDEILYGTMLRCRRVSMLGDGRSAVETVGTWRFKILSRTWVDGYMVAKIERIDDYPPHVEAMLDSPLLNTPSSTSSIPSSPPTPTPVAISRSALLSSPRLAELLTPLYDPNRPFGPAEIQSATTEELVARCLAFIERMRRRVAPWVSRRMDEAYGEMPGNDSDRLSYWMALVLPIDDYDKGKLLSLRSPRLRLRLIAHWINSLDRQGWWQSSGCVVM